MSVVSAQASGKSYEVGKLSGILLLHFTQLMVYCFPAFPKASDVLLSSTSGHRRPKYSVVGLD